MPDYEFRCLECGEVFLERRDWRGDTQNAECPKCGVHAHRVYSLVAHFNEFAGFKEDYYVALDKRIGNRREFKDEIKRAEEEHFNDTGIEIQIAHKR